VSHHQANIASVYWVDARDGIGLCRHSQELRSAVEM